MILKDFEFVDKPESLEKVQQIRDAFGPVENLNYTLDEELAALFELARGTHHTQTQEGYCIELGTYRGVTAMVMAQAIKESRIVLPPVFTVDSYVPSSFRLYPEHNKLMPLAFEDGVLGDKYLQKQGADKMGLARMIAYKLGLQDYLAQVIHDSLRFLRLFNLPIRFAYIDSSHDFTTCYNEAMLIKQRLVPGGAIAFHNNEIPSVMNAMSCLFDDEKCFRLHGLSVFYRRK